MQNHTHHPRPTSVSGPALAAGSPDRSRAPEPAASALPLTGHRRGGAVIIVVLAMLSLLIFLGVFFFEFVQEEQLAAQNYATNPFDDTLNPERYFDEADRQLIVGPDATRTMSPFWSGNTFSSTAPPGLTYGSPGTTQSILAHVIGRIQPALNGAQPTDVLPHNGHGITALPFIDNDTDGLFGPGDYALFDMDGDGAADATLPSEDTNGDGVLDVGEDVIIPNGVLDPAFGINFGPAAQPDPSLDAFSQLVASNDALRPFQPDVEYTYPDINNLFLAYEVTVEGVRIRVPSFHRPDLFPNERSGGFQNLYTDAATERLVMRAHSRNQYPDGTVRFLFNPTTAQSGDRSRVIQPFPFFVDSDNDGTFNEMGVYSNAAGSNYDLDVDLTGDGEPDGIWIDLGADIVEMADGRQFVPMFSYHIIDADSLINVNAHGNLQGADENAATFDTAPLSVSNTGASPSEVNPLRALTGNPASLTIPSQLITAQTEHAANTGFPSNVPFSILAMANLEWEFMTTGRPTSRSGSRLAGRYGEESSVGTGTPPRAGITGVDDDFDTNPTDNLRYQGGARRYQTQYDPRGNGGAAGSADVTIPHASHPIDPKGTGGGVYSATGVQVTPAAGSPVVWKEYFTKWEYPQSGTVPPGAVPTVEAITPYGPAPVAPFTTALFPAGTVSVVDEEDETRLTNPDRVYDDIFRAEENLKLQLSSADYQRIGAGSRIEALAPFNFRYSRTAPQTLSRFTTDSWDLSELSYVPSKYDAMTGTRTETSEWPGAFSTSTGLPTGTRLFFPPDFNASGTTVFLANDPIRPEVRALLAMEDSNSVNGPGYNRRDDLTLPLISGNTGTGAAQLWRQPLNLNKLLVGFDNTGCPIFRPLMPHPDILAMENTVGVTIGTITIPAMIHDHDIAVPVLMSDILPSPGNNADRTSTATAMEWWARYDRQRMARDIYTLLYIVGAPNGFDPKSSAYPNREVVREMAQFAVNYVDALDRDDVMTRFEYDNDLSDGWSWTTGDSVVYGIERTSLSFSEVQFLQTTPRANVTTTLHDDDALNVHQYLHMELRNSSPFRVDLAEGWRISRVMRDMSGKGTGIRDKSVEFKTNGFGTATADAKYVDPGANFLIGTHDGNVVNGVGAEIGSDLYADVDNGGELECVLPFSPNTVPNDSAVPNPQTNLDLGVPAAHPHYQYFTHVPGDADSKYEFPNTAMPAPMPPLATPTHLVRQIDGVLPSTAAAPEANLAFDLVLERRQNPNGVEASAMGNTTSTSSMGEWIEVDRFHVRSQDMGISAPDDAVLTIAGAGSRAEVQTALSNLNSVERRQPFDPVQLTHATGNYSNHSMDVTVGPVTSSAANDAFTGTEFTLWQPHFDRDFTSAYELLSVPLYGNWPLTELVDGLNTETTAATPAGSLTENTFYKEIHGGTQFNLAPGADAGGSGKMSGDFTAGIRFNFPNGLPGKPYQGWNEFTYQNCWYRLLDFVTVPRRADQQSEELRLPPNFVSGSTKPVFRVPGKINLNTMRDETVLAALIDDDVHLAYGGAKATDDQVTGPDRNWFLELLQSRDGTDYFADFAGTPGLPIPNSLVSHPFRGTSHVDPGWTVANRDDRSVENGLLRSSTRRNGALVDIRPATAAAYTTPTLTSPVDFTSSGLWSGAPPHEPLAPVAPYTEMWQGLFDSGDLANTDIDHHTRNRILAKIANNSTNKSHVYFVWAAVGYFEAHRDSASNQVQIGARMTDIPVHRRFSVVDMTRLDDAYNTSSNTFDEKKFVIYQKRLR